MIRHVPIVGASCVALSVLFLVALIFLNSERFAAFKGMLKASLNEQSEMKQMNKSPPTGLLPRKGAPPLEWAFFYERNVAPARPGEKSVHECAQT